MSVAFDITQYLGDIEVMLSEQELLEKREAAHRERLARALSTFQIAERIRQVRVEKMLAAEARLVTATNDVVESVRLADEAADRVLAACLEVARVRDGAPR